MMQTQNSLYAALVGSLLPMILLVPCTRGKGGPEDSPPSDDLVFQSLPPIPISNLTFSPDGAWLASGIGGATSSSSHIAIWDFKSRKISQRIDLEARFIGLGFGDNSNFFFVESVSSVDIWRLENGVYKLRHMLTKSVDPFSKGRGIISFAFCAKASLLAVSQNTENGIVVKLVDINAAENSSSFLPSKFPMKMFLSPKGKYLAIVSDSVTIHEVASGDALFDIPDSAEIASQLNRGLNASIVFSPSGTLLALSSNEGKTRVIRSADGIVEAEHKAHPGGCVRFEQDETQLLILEGQSAKGSRKFLKLDTVGGSNLGSPSLVSSNDTETNFRYPVKKEPIAFHPQYPVYVQPSTLQLSEVWRSDHEVISIRDAATDNRIGGTFALPAGIAGIVASADSGRSLLTLENSVFSLWDLGVGNRRVLMSHGIGENIVGFMDGKICVLKQTVSPKGMLLSVAQAHLNDIPSATSELNWIPFVRGIKGPPSIHCEPDSQHIVVTDSNGIHIFDCSANSLQISLMREPANHEDELGWAARTTAVDEQGNRVYIVDTLGNFEVWELTPGKLISRSSADTLDGRVPASPTLQLNISDLALVDNSGSGQKLIAATNIGLAEFSKGKWEVLKQGPSSFQARSVEVDRGGTVAAAASGSEVIVWNLKTGDVSERISAKNASNLHFVEGTDQLVFAERDLGWRIIDWKKGNEIVRGIAVGKADYFLVNDEGYYKSSRGALPFVCLKVGLDVSTVGESDYFFNRPSKVLKSIGLSQPTEINRHEAIEEMRLELAGANVDSKSDAESTSLYFPEEPPLVTEKTTLTLSCEVSLLDGESAFVELIVDGVPAGQFPLNSVSGDLYRAIVKVPLGPKENNLQFALRSARSGRYAIRSRHVYCSAAFPRSRVYFAGIGISDYPGKSHDLDYARKDVEDFASFVSGDRTRKSSVFLLRDSEADSFSAAKIKKFFEASSPNDLVILMLSGHGFRDDSGVFSFATSQTNLSKADPQGISFTEIENIFAGIQSRNRHVIIDSCYAGEFAAPRIPVAEFPKKGFTVTARNAAPIGSEQNQDAQNFDEILEQFADFRVGDAGTVLAAAGANQYALESGDWKNGVFTFSLLEGLREKKADMNGDDSISSIELLSYCRNRVKELTYGSQVPMLKRENFGFETPIVEAQAPQYYFEPASTQKGGIIAMQRSEDGEHLGLAYQVDSEEYLLRIHDAETLNVVRTFRSNSSRHLEFGFLSGARVVFKKGDDTLTVASIESGASTDIIVPTEGNSTVNWSFLISESREKAIVKNRPSRGMITIVDFTQSGQSDPETTHFISKQSIINAAWKDDGKLILLATISEDLVFSVHEEKTVASSALEGSSWRDSQIGSSTGGHYYAVGRSHLGGETIKVYEAGESVPVSSFQDNHNTYIILTADGPINIRSKVYSNLREVVPLGKRSVRVINLLPEDSGPRMTEAPEMQLDMTKHGDLFFRHLEEPTASGPLVYQSSTIELINKTSGMPVIWLAEMYKSNTRKKYVCLSPDKRAVYVAEGAGVVSRWEITGEN